MKRKTKAWRYKGDRFTEKKFQPYALAIGQSALAWNDLYEALADLFCTLNGAGWNAPHLALWHSQTLDRPKRQMLKATVVHLTEVEKARFPQMREAVKWIVDRTEELEDARNNTVHLPLLLIRKGTGGIVDAAEAMGIYVPDIMTQTLNNHPRALRMTEKDLLAEFRWCRDAILVVRDFTHHLDRALTADNAPWPDIPKLPARPGQRSRRSQRHRGGPKPHVTRFLTSPR